MVFNQDHNERQAKNPICSIWNISTLAQLSINATDFGLLDNEYKKVVLLSSILNSSLLWSPRSKITCCPTRELINLRFPEGAIQSQRTAQWRSVTAVQLQHHQATGALAWVDQECISGAGRAGNRGFELIKVRGLLRIYWRAVKWYCSFS